MDGDSQPTQQATQNVLDPRRLGQQNSGFTDEDIADIICLLFPYTSNTRSEARRLAREGNPYIIGGDDAQAVDVDYTYEDYAANFALSAATPPGPGPAFILRLSDQVKNPLQGFTFGRNTARCDICFSSDSLRRLSNIHFRVFINEHGVLMLQDQSTNGTIVDETLLKAKVRRPGVSTMRTLTSGTKISILLQDHAKDLAFLVRVPRRDGQHETAYKQNVNAYLERIAALAAEAEGVHPQQQQQQQQHIKAGPTGIVNLFGDQHQLQTAQVTRGGEIRRPPPPAFGTSKTDNLARDWNGSDSYNRIGQIGKGAFATVHKVTAKFDGKPYAAKELDKRRFIKNGVLDQKVENEMRIMQNVQHPNIVRYIEHFDDDRLFIIIMEFVANGDLGSYISTSGRMSESTVKEMASQLINALGYLHRKNITHRDVKPDNILIDSFAPFTVKLTDFGLSKMVDNEQTFLRTFCGTLLYCAPEVYAEYTEYDENGHRTNRNRKRMRQPGQRYDHAVDIWSLGGVLFYCLTGSPPFPVKQGTSYAELLHWIMTQSLNVDPLLNAGVSPEGVDFLSRMLQRRPENRATIDSLLNHVWLAGPLATTTALAADDLEQSASQLSLADRQAPLPLDPSDDEILDDGDMDLQDVVPDFNEHAETIRPQALAGHQPRLFGEVNVSAIGSSGVIPEEKLNLPLSDLDENKSPSPPIHASAAEESASASLSLHQAPTPLRSGNEWSQPHAQPHSLTPKGGDKSAGQCRVPAALSQSRSNHFQQSHSVDALNNLTFDVASQSLGCAESMLGNLFVKSLAPAAATLSSTDLTTSKRKPAHDTSDEFETSTPRADKPTIKRLKSDVHLGSASNPALRRKSKDFDGTENVGTAGGNCETIFGGELECGVELYAAVEPISHSKTGRQIDHPVSKATYWVPGNPDTWHLNYPEMTQLQYDMFEDAAMARQEEFGPGQSRLWDLAMKHFPPTVPELGRSQSNPLSSAVSNTVSPSAPEDEGDTDGEQKENIVPQGPSSLRPSLSSATYARARTQGVQEPSETVTQAPYYTQQVTRSNGRIVVPILDGNGKQQPPKPGTTTEAIVAARLDASPSSIVQNISIPITESITFWGRGLENTQVYVPRDEKRVPKCAFKILLWRNPGMTNGHGSSRGSEPWKDLTPWDRLDAHGETAGRYHFYISTKARQGILVNGTPISSVNPDDVESPARYWAQLNDGDSIIVWHKALAGTAERGMGERTELVFRCAWGGSAVPRGTVTLGNAQAPSASTVVLVDELTSRRLDEACERAERFVKNRALQRIRLAEADRDVAERRTRIGQERQRSIVFEQCRAEVLRHHPGLGGGLTGGNGKHHEPHRPKLSSMGLPVSAPSVMVFADSKAK